MARLVPDPNDPTLFLAVADPSDQALLEIYAKLKEIAPGWRPQHEGKITKPAAPAPGGGKP